MKRLIVIIALMSIILALYAQSIQAYEFAGKRFRIRNTNGEPKYFYGPFVWSADSRYVFTYGYNERYNFIETDFLYMVAADGGDAVLLFDAEEEDFGLEYHACKAQNISANPDGSGIRFQLSYYDPTRGSFYEKKENGTSHSNGTPIIVTYDISTRETTVIIDGGNSPVWSPDGRYLLYRHFDDMFYIDRDKAENQGAPIIYDTMSGDSEFLEFPESLNRWYYNIHNIVFGPRSEYIYFVMDCNMEYDPDDPLPDKIMPGTPYYGEYQIARRPIHGGEIELLTKRLQGSAGYFSFSPDGRWMLFNDKADVLVLDVSTGSIYNALTGKRHTEARYIPEQRENGGSFTVDGESADPETDKIYRFIMPIFLPNGTQFIYSPTFNFYTSYDNDLYIVDFDPSLYTRIGSVDNNTDGNSQQNKALSISSFPNPFNLVTTIKFDLREGGNAKLVIYDITGRKVRELANGFFYTGSHAIPWDGRDDNGNMVSSGVFILQLSSGGNAASHIMTLVK